MKKGGKDNYFVEEVVLENQEIGSVIATKRGRVGGVAR